MAAYIQNGTVKFEARSTDVTFTFKDGAITAMAITVLVKDRDGRVVDAITAEDRGLTPYYNGKFERLIESLTPIVKED